MDALWGIFVDGRAGSGWLWSLTRWAGCCAVGRT